jgi:hypothetical protein
MYFALKNIYKENHKSQKNNYNDVDFQFVELILFVKNNTFSISKICNNKIFVKLIFIESHLT